MGKKRKKNRATFRKFGGRSMRREETPTWAQNPTKKNDKKDWEMKSGKSAKRRWAGGEKGERTCERTQLGSTAVMTSGEAQKKNRGG